MLSSDAPKLVRMSSPEPESDDGDGIGTAAAPVTPAAVATAALTGDPVMTGDTSGAVAYVTAVDTTADDIKETLSTFSEIGIYNFMGNFGNILLKNGALNEL